MIKKLSQKNHKYTKKQKLGIFALSIIFICSILTITGTLPLASLFGGDSSNQYGGYFSASASGQNGETTTTFAECDVDHIDISITNNANSPFSTTETTTIKRKPITVTSVTDITDYQKKITIPYATGMGTNFEYIEIKDASNNIIPMWIEDYTSSTSADVWVKGDFSTGDTIIYVHYGDGITTVNDPDNVFLEFDQFDTLDEWSISSGKGTLVLSTDYVDSGIYSAKRSGEEDHMYRSDCAYDNAIYEIKLYTSASSNLDGIFNIKHDGNTLNLGAENVFNVNYFYYRYISNKYATSIPQSVGWHELKFIFDGTNLAGYTDGTKVTPDYTYTSIDGTIGIGDAWTTGYAIYYDTFKVRKYAPTEPTYIIGSEETIFDSTITLSKQQVLTIDNTGGSAITDYDLPFTLTYDTDMQSDFDDLWFTEIDGTHIPHFKAYYTDSTSAKIYISLDCDADSTKEIKMYYGNEYASDLSDGESMFTIFEGFDTAIDTNDWYINIGSGDSYSLSNSKMILSWNDANELVTFLDSKTLFDSPIIVESHLQPNMAGTTSGTTGSRFTFAFHSTSQQHWNDGYYDGYGSYLAMRGDSPNDVVNAISPNAITQNNVDYNGQWIEMSTIFKSGDMSMSIDDESVSTNTESLTNGYVGLHYFSSISYAVGTQSAIFDYIIVRPYIANEPTVSFGTEMTLANPTITASCVGDSNAQVYGAETKDFSLIPTSDISQFVVDGSPDYDFDATIYYSGTTNVVENATAGTMTITFTPDVIIESGYANGMFSEDVTFEEYTLAATLDEVAIENFVFENNNTVSVELTNCDATEHVIDITITESINTPIISSSGGGGGSAAVPATSEEIVEENDTKNKTNVEDSNQYLDFTIFDSDITTIIIFVSLIIIVGYLVISRRKN